MAVDVDGLADAVLQHENCLHANCTVLMTPLQTPTPISNSANPVRSMFSTPQADRAAGAGAAPQHLLPPLHALYAGGFFMWHDASQWIIFAGA